MVKRSMLGLCRRTVWTWKSGFLPGLALLAGMLPAQTTKLTAGNDQLKERSLVVQLQGQPRNGDLWFDMGVVRARLGESDAAIAAFQHAARLSPDKLASYRNVVALAIAKNDFPLAISTCSEALVHYPKDVEILQNYAYVLMRTEHYKEARGPLSTLKQARPGDVAIRISLILTLQHSGDAVEGETELKELLAKPLLSRDQGVALVGEFEQQHQLSAAQETNAYLEKRWRTVPTAQPRQAGAESEPLTVESGPAATAKTGDSGALVASIRKASALIESEHYVDAMQFLVGARAQFPRQPELEYQSALTDVCLQRYAEALARLQEMKRQGWDSAQVEFLRAGAFEISGEVPNAEFAYRAAIAADPANFMYYRALGALLQKQGMYGESSGPLEKALALQPDDSGTLILLARCRERAGDVDGAVSLLEHAVNSDPGSRRAHALLAVLYSKRSRVSDAEKQQAIAATLEDQKIKQWTIWGTTPQVKN